jgi:membrane protein YdbS with pleckstrin-like domain
MAFPDRLLNEGETVVVDVHPHWWYMVRPTLAVIVTVAGAIAAAVESAPIWVKWIPIAALAASAGWLIGRYIRWKTIRLVVTNVRIMDRRGLIMRRGREIPIGALTNIGYRQTLFKRLIGAGDIVLESAGRDSEEVFPDLPNPALIHNEIYRQLEIWRNGGAAGSARGGPGPRTGVDARSIPAQIEQLDVLRRRGIITEAEFAAKKTELLDRL